MLLDTFDTCTPCKHPSGLDAGQGDTLDEVALGKQKEQQHRRDDRMPRQWPSGTRAARSGSHASCRDSPAAIRGRNRYFRSPPSAP